MIQVAVYGKGGIGKSTVSANVSYMLAGMGKKVLQIGCDPKHDSTRLLLGEREQRTVLEYIRDTAPYDRRLEDVVADGANGVKCVEAGGPEPGIGCAGRGILTTFDTLRKLGIDKLPTDVKLYDVLGDVVCGGFAVPLRSEYSDAVFLVTSGEFMSVYAANNILKGLRNFDDGRPRVAGVILNSRGDAGEYDAVKRFADAVGLPIVSVIPRDRLFSSAESGHATVAQLFPDSEAASSLRRIAERIVRISEGRAELYHPRPLDSEGLFQYARMLPISPCNTVSPGSCQCRHTARRRAGAGTEKKIVHSCGAAGSVYPLLFLEGTATILHGPRSCAHIMAASRDMTDAESKALLAPCSSRLRCTGMDDSVSVFGGGDLLRTAILDEINSGTRYVFVVTSCVSGIIGDDVEDIVRSVGRDHPEAFVRAVMADGNIIGEWDEGYAATADMLMDLVEDGFEPDPMAVNVIGERYFFRQGECESDVADLFRPFGMRVNCRFMHETSIDDIRGFRRAGLTVSAAEDRAANAVSRIIERRLGIRVEHGMVPVGMSGYRSFAERIAERTGDRTTAIDVLYAAEEKYRSEMVRHRERFGGRSVIVMDKFTQDIDWLLEVLDDIGARIILVGVGPGRARPRDARRSRFEGSVTFVDGYGIEALKEDIERERPYAVLSDSMLVVPEGQRFMLYSRPGPGIDCVLEYARKLADLTRVPGTEGWRRI